jgi:carboxypeptidase Taq
MAVHESQSLLMEMQACRSPEFLGYLSPLLVEGFGDDPAFAPANLRRVYARVEPGFIRVNADEVTYPAHVILRTRLERAMIAGDLAPADLPGAWAEGLKGLLGIVPPNDRLGCLQDPHWFGGDFGYFPTYTLGAMAAAQLYATALAERPGIPAALGRGDFAPLLGWLREKVHGLGSLPATTDELLTAATGRPLDPAIFLAHLNRRYLGG